MTVETATALLLKHAPRIGERLAKLAMEWTVVVLSDHDGIVSQESLADLPDVKMYDVDEIVANARNGHPGVRVGQVADEFSTEYLVLDPETGEFTTERE